MNVRYDLEYYERTALEALRDDARTSHRLQDLINDCYSYRWELLREWIEMLLRLRYGIKVLMASSYPNLLLLFNDLLPPQFKYDLQNLHHRPTVDDGFRFQRNVKDWLRINQPRRYAFIKDQLRIFGRGYTFDDDSSPVYWEAVAMVYTALWSEFDLLREFLQLQR